MVPSTLPLSSRNWKPSMLVIRMLSRESDRFVQVNAGVVRTGSGLQSWQPGTGGLAVVVRVRGAHRASGRTLPMKFLFSR
jgi:hypothetical protein